MGGAFSRFWGQLTGSKEMRILMLGLDAAGKTTILYKLKLNQSVTTIPTVGFNVETVTYRNVNFNVWDVGGQDKIRPLWRHYYTGTQGLIFVVDSQDRDRIEEARQELAKIMNDREMKDCLLLIFANKQDLPHGILFCRFYYGSISLLRFLVPKKGGYDGLINMPAPASAMPPTEITEKLGLQQLRERNWYVHPSCATSGEGLFQGLQWLVDSIKKK